jgi:hypothetical protein
MTWLMLAWTVGAAPGDPSGEPEQVQASTRAADRRVADQAGDGKHQRCHRDGVVPDLACLSETGAKG